ncbi:hypothetical protein BDZ88DRAFT_107540 [Geranomyces variabilis]|nr:hypothetical protein BDZ88DRAFT_107540 [Geranomyces variabilis]
MNDGTTPSGPSSPPAAPAAGLDGAASATTPATPVAATSENYTTVPSPPNPLAAAATAAAASSSSSSSSASSSSSSSPVPASSTPPPPPAPSPPAALVPAPPLAPTESAPNTLMFTVVLEGTAAMGQHFDELYMSYILPIITNLNNQTLARPPSPPPEPALNPDGTPATEQPASKRRPPPLIRCGLVVYADYPPYSVKTVQKLLVGNKLDELLVKIKTVRFEDGGFMRNAVTEGLVAALEVSAKRAFRPRVAHVVAVACVSLSHSNLVTVRLAFVSLSSAHVRCLTIWSKWKSRLARWSDSVSSSPQRHRMDSNVACRLTPSMTIFTLPRSPRTFTIRASACLL